jgi:hypothetical protein
MDNLFLLNKMLHKDIGKHSILPSQRTLRRKKQRKLDKLDKLLRSKGCTK